MKPHALILYYTGLDCKQVVTFLCRPLKELLFRFPIFWKPWLGVSQDFKYGLARRGG
jgi:hypothetical protein